jgi:hypothetical protein
MLVRAQSTCENVTFDLVCTVLYWTWPVWCLGLSVCLSVSLSVILSIFPSDTRSYGQSAQCALTRSPPHEVSTICYYNVSLYF